MQCWKTNGTSRLKIVDHDSMGGEQIWVASGLIFTSGKWGIWPLATPQNHGFVKLQISQGGKEKPRHNMHINTTYGGGGTMFSILEKWNYLLLWIPLVWGKGILDLWKVIVSKEDHLSFSLWTHGEARGWIKKTNLVVLFYGWVEHGCSICVLASNF